MTTVDCSTPASKAEILELLAARGAEQGALHAAAREARTQAWRDAAVVRGVIEITNRCRANCGYCPMRCGNPRKPAPYVLSPDQILDAARNIQAAGLSVVFLQAGEMPETTRLAGSVIPRIKDLFPGRVEVLLCLGNKSRDEYAYLRDQGADSYILKHETSDPVLHQELRGQPLRERLDCLEVLIGLGYKTGTGAIVGLPGQSLESLADDILLARDLGAHMVSASPFIPAGGTPLEACPTGGIHTTLNMIAVSRLCRPEWLIPTVSALGRVEPDGQFRGLRAGANVLTVNHTPPEFCRQYPIYGQDRRIVQLANARQLLERAGLRNRGARWIR
jgi:biotin synthase